MLKSQSMSVYLAHPSRIDKMLSKLIAFTLLSLAISYAHGACSNLRIDGGIIQHKTRMRGLQVYFY